MNFKELLQEFLEGRLTFPELTEKSTKLTWGTKTTLPDGTLEWVGDNLYADVYNTVLNHQLTLDQRRVLLDAITETQKTQA